MRWLLFVLVLVAQPALANPWSCSSTLSTQDRNFGISDTTFRLYLGPNGRFDAWGDEAPEAFRSWRWSGKWTGIDDQIAMIGKAQFLYNDPILLKPGQTEDELRAFSTVVQDDVLLFKMTRRTYQDTLVRCLREEF